jgi:hypothetical protein
MHRLRLSGVAPELCIFLIIDCQPCYSEHLAMGGLVLKLSAWMSCSFKCENIVRWLRFSGRRLLILFLFVVSSVSR